MKILFFAFCSFLFFSHVKAQSLHFGLKAGPNLGKVNGKSFKEELNWGYQLGGWAELDFSDRLGIQPEVIFTQTNTKTLTSADAQLDNLIKPDFKAHLNYLAIPVLLRINASDLLTFHIGPQFGIKMKNGQSLLTNGQDAFKSGDVAAVGGLQLNLSKFRL